MSGDDPKDEGPLRKETVASLRDELIYGVGYKQPPKHTQFQPGQSGNPRGRPRGAPPDLSLAEQPALEAVLRIAAKPVKIREGDRVFDVPMREAITQAVFAAALKGNARSQGLAIDLMRTVDQMKARDVKESNAFWSRYKEEKSAELAEAAAAKGGPLPHLLPHPDDIVIDRTSGPRFLGPIDAEEMVQVQETIAFCETLLMQNVLDSRSTHRLDGEPLTEPGSALLLFYAVHHSIPPRLRLSDAHIAARLMKYEAWPKRRLLKALHQAWQEIGKLMPRGMISPNLSVTRKNLAFLYDLDAKVTAKTIDLDAWSRGEPDDAALDLLDKHWVKIE